MPTTPPAIELSSLSHAYLEGGRSNSVLDNITATLQANRVCALLGRSGSGKSTLLNLISGLEPLQSGDIRLAGTSLARLGDRQRTLLRRRHIGFIYQSFNLIPTLSVYENTALPLALNQSKSHSTSPPALSREQQQARVQELLSGIGLADRAHDFPDQLSGGEQQRVAIARALVHKPALILADEPTGNLDAGSGRRVLALLLELVEACHSTLLLVTHSREVASRAEDIWTLQDGQLLPRDAGSAW